MKEIFKKLGKHFKRDWQLHLLLLLPVLYCLIFYYEPMYGVQIAFRDFKIAKGITGSKFVGWKWFVKFFTDYQFKTILRNTIILSLYTIVVTFPIPVIFALLVNSMRSKKAQKFTQTVSYIPHFVSVTVLVSILTLLFNPVNGLYGNLYRLLGNEGYPADFRAAASSFRHLYVWSAVWQETGWNAIIYTAALGNVSPELHESAEMDGASRLQRVIHVDFPAILPTVCIMLILRFGSVMTIGFEKVFLMQTNLNLDASEIISTYVYKKGLSSPNNYSYGTAIGLFNSLINCVLLVAVNYISKRLSDEDVSLF